jgi:hypothetical protein
LAPKLRTPTSLDSSGTAVILLHTGRLIGQSCRALISVILPTGSQWRRDCLPDPSGLRQIHPSNFPRLSECDLRRLIDKTYSGLDTAHPAPGVLEQYYELLEDLESR